MTTIELEHRRGQTFFHRDTRLPKGHPTITRSFDVTGICSSRGPWRTVRLDYGIDGAGRLTVEVAILHRDRFIYWCHWWYHVDRLWDPDDPHNEGLADLARGLGLTAREFALLVIAHAPRRTRKRFGAVFGRDQEVRN